MPLCVPEPEPNKSQEDKDHSLHIHQVIVESSDDDVEELDQPQLNGYEPIPMVDHNDECSEDEEQPASSAELPHKSFEIDQDLVRHAMKNVKLDLSSIPLWAREISDSAWDEVVKQTVTKGAAPNFDETGTSSSSRIEPHSSNPT